MTRRTRIYASVSPYTRCQIDKLCEEHGTIREVITLAVDHLARTAAGQRPTHDDYGRIESGHQAISEGELVRRSDAESTASPI